MGDQYGPTTEEWAAELERWFASRGEPFYGRDWPNPETPDPAEEVA